MLEIEKIVSKLSAAFGSWAGWLLGVASWLAPLKDAYILLITVLAFDFIAGITASRKQHIPWSSGRFRLSITKSLFYFIIIFLLYMVEMAVGTLDFICTYKAAAGFISSVEIVSIIENMYIITKHPVFAKLLRFIRGKAADGSDEESLLNDILNEKHK